VVAVQSVDAYDDDDDADGGGGDGCGGASWSTVSVAMTRPVSANDSDQLPTSS
jgi:hypothetical protein